MGGKRGFSFSFLILCLVSVLLCGCRLNLKTQTELKPELPPVKNSTAPITQKKKSVIVYRSDFRRAAKYFSYLHQEYEGVDSLLLSVRSFNSTDTELKGIADDIRSKIKELDDKYGVISVVLLGDYGIIPPVQYKARTNSTRIFTADAGYGFFGGNPENAISVGRIPAISTEQAFDVAAKYDRWYDDKDYRPAWPVAFMGGEGLSNSDLRDSELVFFRLQEEGMAGPEAIRYLGGSGGFTERRFYQSLSWDDAAVEWLMVPTENGIMKFNDSFVNSTRIISMSYKPGLPLILDPYGSFPSDSYTNSSISSAKAMLLSSGAALGVITGSFERPDKSEGDIAKAELDRGTLLRVDLSGRSQFMLEFHKAYFSGKLRISEALTEARSQYEEYQSGNEDESFNMLAGIVFLGDPTISMPLAIRTETPVYQGLKPVSKPLSSNGVATYPSNSTVTFAMQDNSIYPAVKVKVVDRKSGHIVAENTVGREDLFNFRTDSPGSFMFYSQPIDGPLAWQFFDICSGNGTAKNEDTIPPVIKAGLEPIKYSVQVSSNRIRSSAENMTRRLVAKGYPAYVVIAARNGRKPWYCVRFGEYESFFKAQEASSGYEKSEKADARVVRCKVDD